MRVEFTRNTNSERAHSTEGPNAGEHPSKEGRSRAGASDAHAAAAAAGAEAGWRACSLLPLLSSLIILSVDCMARHAYGIARHCTAPSCSAQLFPSVSRFLSQQRT